MTETRQYNPLSQLTRITCRAPQRSRIWNIAIRRVRTTGGLRSLKNWVSGEKVNYSTNALQRLSSASTTGPAMSAMGTIIATRGTCQNENKCAVLFWVLLHSSPASTQPPICDDHVVVLPAYLGEDELPLSRRHRFEIRECKGGRTHLLQINSLGEIELVDVKDVWPRSLYHSYNTLVVQTLGGSGSAVYILQFQRGAVIKPRVYSTRGNISIRTDISSGDVIITIPPDNDSEKTRQVRLVIEPRLAPLLEIPRVKK